MSDIYLLWIPRERKTDNPTNQGHSEYSILVLCFVVPFLELEHNMKTHLKWNHDERQLTIIYSNLGYKDCVSTLGMTISVFSFFFVRKKKDIGFKCWPFNNNE